ncbi:hypothetical protein L6452_21903 [Arctium lappa]|uniref:Uncharacterized protein n=1 Tax=Arctium lappa TaxID=4217 RepID=A0ACB9AZL4_ARCLA|nr:hypothetical protein L6452_21903 [Arctium lappa]
MMTGGVTGEGFFRGGVFEGCISYEEMGVNRRPYHRNCTCPLHRMCEHNSRLSVVTSVSYHVRRVWSEGSLAMMVSTDASSPCSSASGTITKVTRDWRSLFDFCGDEDREL